jgi:hypothetical protein
LCFLPEHIDPFRIRAVKCNVEEKYFYNDRFTCQSGQKFWVDGQLKFTPLPVWPVVSTFYKTCFGPSVSTDGSIFDDSNENVNLAIRRLIAVKFPEKPGYEAQLFENQAASFGGATELWTMLRSMYAKHLQPFTTLMDECIEHHADPHDKRELRISGFKNLTEGDGEIHGNWVRRKRVMWKLKKGEWAKPNKKPRMIVDLGVEASLLGFRLTNFLKLAQAQEPLFINGGEIRFCKSPDLYALEDVFKNLINPQGRFFFVYFSDDACLSIRDKNGVIRMYNLDISSCDASQGPAVFKALLEITPDELKPEMELLISQCKSPLKVSNRERPKESVKLQPSQLMMYSGWTGTTAINNLANIMIAYKISQIEEFEDGEQIRLAAESAGYVVSGFEQPLEGYHQLQFLKHSPVMDNDGVIRPMLNVGVLLRASGMCKFDLPGTRKIPMLERARRFQRGLYQGAYPKCTFPLLENMKRAVGDGESYHTDLFLHKVVDGTYPHYSVSSEEMFRRYNLNSVEINDVVETFGNLGVGFLYASPGLGKILYADYGLNCKYTRGVASQ